MTDKCYLYFIKCLDKRINPVKIGISKNPELRIETLQVGCPYPLKLIVTIECKSRGHAENLENQLHKVFRFACLGGEWFKGDVITLKRVEPLIADGLVIEKRSKDIIFGNKKEQRIKRLQDQNYKLKKKIEQAESNHKAEIEKLKAEFDADLDAALDTMTVNNSFLQDH